MSGGGASRFHALEEQLQGGLKNIPRNLGPRIATLTLRMARDETIARRMMALAEEPAETDETADFVVVPSAEDPHPSDEDDDEFEVLLSQRFVRVRSDERIDVGERIGEGGELVTAETAAAVAQPTEQYSTAPEGLAVAVVTVAGQVMDAISQMWQWVCRLFHVDAAATNVENHLEKYVVASAMMLSATIALSARAVGDVERMLAYAMDVVRRAFRTFS